MLFILLPVQAVGKHLPLTVIHAGSTAPIDAISRTVSRAVAGMDKEQFRAERLYLMSLSVAKAMLRKGIISEKELVELDAILLNKYQPVLGTLLAGKPLV